MSPAKSATGARARIPRSKSATKANRLRSQSVPKPAFSPFGTTPTEREKKGPSVLKSQDLIEVGFFWDFKETEAGDMRSEEVDILKMHSIVFVTLTWPNSDLNQL